MFKKLSCAICLMGLAFGASAETASTSAGAEQTASGHVTFTGVVQGTACTISSDTTDHNVSLGSVGVNTLKSANGGSTPVNFKMVLQNCTFVNNGTTTASLLLSGTSDGTLLKNTHTDDDTRAVGVGVEVTYKGSTDKVIDFSGEVDARTTPETVFGETGEWAFPFSARMKAVTQGGADVKAGDVYAQMNVQMTYK